MAGVFGDTRASGSLSAGAASYGYRMGYDAPASTVSITPYKQGSPADDPRAKYLALFGYPANAEARDPYESFNQDHYTMPAAYAGRNVYLEQLIITQISEDEQWPIRKALTLTRNDKGLTIEWDQFIFNDSLLDRTPEESVSRFLSSKNTGGAAAMLRMGIGLQWENGFLDTPRGQLWFATSMLQITNASVETCCASVMVALMTFDPKDFPVFMRNESFQVGSRVFLMGLLDEEKDYFAVLQRRAHGDRLMLARLQTRFQARNSRGSTGPGNLLIVPGGSTQWYELTHPIEQKHSETGKVGGPRPTTPQRLFQGIDTVESRPVLTGENDQRMDPFYSLYAIGDYFDMSSLHLDDAFAERDFRTHFVNTSVFSSVNNAFTVIRFEEMVGKSGLFIEDERGAQGQSADFRVGGRYSAAPSSKKSTWALTQIGVRFFKGSRTWGEFIKSKCSTNNSMKLICNAILRDERTFQDFRATFFPADDGKERKAMREDKKEKEKERLRREIAQMEREAEAEKLRLAAEEEEKKKKKAKLGVTALLQQFAHHTTEDGSDDKPSPVTHAARTLARNLQWTLKHTTSGGKLKQFLETRLKSLDELFDQLLKGGGDNGARAAASTNFGELLAGCDAKETSSVAGLLATPWLDGEKTPIVVANAAKVGTDAMIVGGRFDLALPEVKASNPASVAALVSYAAGIMFGIARSIDSAKALWTENLSSEHLLILHVEATRRLKSNAVWSGHAHFAYLVREIYQDLVESTKTAKPVLSSKHSTIAAAMYDRVDVDFNPASAGASSGHSFRIREKARHDYAKAKVAKSKDKAAKKYIAAYDDMTLLRDAVWEKLRSAAPRLYGDAGLADTLNHFALRHIQELGGTLNDNLSANIKLGVVQSLFRALNDMYDDDSIEDLASERHDIVLGVLDRFFERPQKLVDYLASSEGGIIASTDFQDDVNWENVVTDQLAAIGRDEASHLFNDKEQTTKDLHNQKGWNADSKRDHSGISRGFRGAGVYTPMQQSGAPTGADIEQALDRLEITDGDFVRWSLLNNIPPVLKIRGCRPEIVYEMGTAILMKGNGAAGNVFFGHQNVTVGADAMRKMGNLHYTLYNKCLLLHPELVVHSFCCNSKMYMGGGDHDICDITSSEQQSRKTRGERPGSIYPVPVYIDEDVESDMVADMTGRFARELYLPGGGRQGMGPSKPLMQASVARRWGILRATDPRNRRMYGGQESAAHNTILCRAASYKFNPNTKQYDIETLSNGHWGQNWYDGCADVHNSRVAVPLEDRRGPNQRSGGGSVVVSISK